MKSVLIAIALASAVLATSALADGDGRRGDGDGPRHHGPSVHHNGYGVPVGAHGFHEGHMRWEGGHRRYWHGGRWIGFSEALALGLILNSGVWIGGYVAPPPVVVLPATPVVPQYVVPQAQSCPIGCVPDLK